VCAESEDEAKLLAVASAANRMAQGATVTVEEMPDGTLSGAELHLNKAL
jgi:hypothetical protein